MAYTRALDVVVAIIILVVLAFILLIASLINIKDTAVDTRKISIGGLSKISDALKIKYEPYKTENININVESSKTSSGSNKNKQIQTLSKDSCKRDKKTNKTTNCIFEEPNIKNDNLDDIPKYSKRCILKDEYTEICRFV